MNYDKIILGLGLDLGNRSYKLWLDVLDSTLFPSYKGRIKEVVTET